MDKQTVFDIFQETTGTFRATEFSAPAGVKLYVAYGDSLIAFAAAIEQSVIERLNAREQQLQEELAQAKEHWQSLKNVLHDTQKRESALFSQLVEKQSEVDEVMEELARYKTAVNELMLDKRFELLTQHTIDAVYDATGGEK